MTQKANRSRDTDRCPEEHGSNERDGACSVAGVHRRGLDPLDRCARDREDQDFAEQPEPACCSADSPTLPPPHGATRVLCWTDTDLVEVTSVPGLLGSLPGLPGLALHHVVVRPPGWFWFCCVTVQPPKGTRLEEPPGWPPAKACDVIAHSCTSETGPACGTASE